MVARLRVGQSSKGEVGRFGEGQYELYLEYEADRRVMNFVRE